MSDFIELQTYGFGRALDMLRQLPAEVVSKRGGPVKTALRKGASVLARAERIALKQTLRDPDDETTGLLQKSVIVSRGKPPIGGNGERYLVRIKRKIYGNRKGEQVSTVKTAQLKEYGSHHQTAEPFIRPAFKANAEKAIRLVETELPKEIEKIAAKLLNTGPRSP
jgi:HK97 gp10 family phage protein